MRPKRLSGQRGVSVIEAPAALIVIAFLALGVLAFVQVLISYQHLTSATRAAARYASKADYDPSQDKLGPDGKPIPPKWGTRPTSADVVTFAQKSAPEFGSDPSTSKLGVDVEVCTDPAKDATCSTADNQAGAPAQHVHVKGTTTLDDGAYPLISGLVNGLSGFFGAGDAIPPKIKIHSEAVAAYE